MHKHDNSWNAILGNNHATKAAVQFQRLLNTGSPLAPKPEFVSETEGLPYELIVTEERPLCIGALMKFNLMEAEWECLGVEPLSRQGAPSDWKISHAHKKNADELKELPPTELSLVNESGKEIFAECLPYVTMREALSEGTSFEFGCYLVVQQIVKEQTTQIIREGALLDEERARRAQENPLFKPEDLPYIEIDLSHARAFLQDNNTPNADFLTTIEEVTPVTFCDVKGYKLRCSLSAESEKNFPVDFYVFEPVLKKYVPKEGDFISGFGALHVFPLQQVKADTHFGENVFKKMQGSSQNLETALDYLHNHEELPLSVRVIVSAFIRTGWEILETGSKYYSKMIPAFVARKKGGDTYAVYIDTQMKGQYGFPDLNAAEIQEIKKRCKSVGYKDIRFRASMIPHEDHYSVSIAPVGSGEIPFKVSFLIDVPKPEKKDNDEETVREAALAFAETINNSDMKILAPYLSEELHFQSHTMGTNLTGKITFLRYFTIALIKWAQNKLSPQAVVGSVEWQNRRVVSMALLDNDIPQSCTIFHAENGYITEMITLPEEACRTFRKA